MSRLTQCWNHIRSEDLANQFSCWLFGDDPGPGNSPTEGNTKLTGDSY